MYGTQNKMPGLCFSLTPWVGSDFRHPSECSQPQKKGIFALNVLFHGRHSKLHMQLLSSLNGTIALPSSMICSVTRLSVEQTDVLCQVSDCYVWFHKSLITSGTVSMLSAWTLHKVTVKQVSSGFAFWLCCVPLPVLLHCHCVHVNAISTT